MTARPRMTADFIWDIFLFIIYKWSRGLPRRSGHRKVDAGMPAAEDVRLVGYRLKDDHPPIHILKWRRWMHEAGAIDKGAKAHASTAPICDRQQNFKPSNEQISNDKLANWKFKLFWGSMTRKSSAKVIMRISKLYSSHIGSFKQLASVDEAVGI